MPLTWYGDTCRNLTSISSFYCDAYSTVSYLIKLVLLYNVSYSGWSIRVSYWVKFEIGIVGHFFDIVGLSVIGHLLGEVALPVITFSKQ